MKLRSLPLAVSLIQAMHASAFEYPSSLNDTTNHNNPFFLQIWSSRDTAFAYRTIGIEPDEDGTWRAVINPLDVVPGLQLVNGSLQVASPEGLHGTADGFHATFGPETTDGEFVSKSFFFTNETDTSNNNWELLNLSDDGLYSILSNDPAPSTYNGTNTRIPQSVKC